MNSFDGVSVNLQNTATAVVGIRLNSFSGNSVNGASATTETNSQLCLQLLGNTGPDNYTLTQVSVSTFIAENTFGSNTGTVAASPTIILQPQGFCGLPAP